MAVHKRGKHWHYDFTIKGARYRQAIPEARTKAQAEQAENFEKQKLYNSKYGIKTRMMLADFANNIFLKWAKENKRSAYHDEYTLPHLLPYFKGQALQDITAEHIEAFKRQRSNEITRRNKKRSPNTVDRELALISKIFSLAVDYKYLDDSPCRRVKFFHVKPTEKKVITKEDEEKLLAVIDDNDRLRFIVQFGLQTGMRRGELMKLKWADIDFEKELICIPAQITKANKARVLPLMPEVQKILSSIREKDSSREEIFTGWKATLGGISGRFKKACEEAGLAGYSFHCMRHTFSTRLKDAGIHPYVVRDWLGHQSIEMTNHYTHATPSLMREALAQIS